MYKRVILLALFFVFALFSSFVRAESTTYDLSRSYKIFEDGRAEVNLTLTATNPGSDEIPQTISIPIDGLNPREESVTDQSGNTIQSSINQGNNTIDISGISDTSGDKNWQINLSYTSDIGVNFGTSNVFMLEPNNIAELPIAKDTVKFTVDANLGVGITRGAKPSSSSQALGEQVVEWINNEGPIDQSVGIVFGEVAVANFSSETTLKNTSWWWQEKELILPPDTNQQKVVLESIEPKPTSISLDVDGNIIAKYNLRPKQSKTVWASGKIYNHNYTYALTSTSTSAAIPQDLKENYTQTNDVWKADQVEWNSSENPAVTTVLREVFDAVVSQIPDDASGLEESTKWSNTYIGELRSSGVPARLILGRSYESLDSSGNPQPHAWVEAYVPGTGWISVDVMAGKKGESIGYSDVRRVGLLMRGSDPNYPPEQLDGYSFNWISGQELSEPEPAKPTISAKNNIILPGFAIHSVKVEMGQGTIVDNTAISINDTKPIKLGSLAPLQTSFVNSIAIGGDAFSATKVAYGFSDSEQLSGEIIETTTSNNYLPMILIIFAIMLSVSLFYIYKKRYSTPKDKSKHSKTNLVLASEADGSSIEDVDLVSEIEEMPEEEDLTHGPPELDRVEPNIAAESHRQKTTPPKKMHDPKPATKTPSDNRAIKTNHPEPISDTIRPKKKPEVKIGAAGSNPYKKTNLIQ